MNGIHINWTAPGFVRGVRKYRVEPHELLTTVLSAELWKRNYGKMILYTDEAGEEYYRSIGLLPLWDEVRRLVVPESVSPVSFWAAGKLYALRDACLRDGFPVCMIDTDFILWERLPLAAPVTAAHFEPVGTDIYPADLSYYKGAPPAFCRLNEKAPACNTAFCCLRDADFGMEYLNAAAGFMECTIPEGNTLQYMVCAEQRLLGMLAERHGFLPEVLIDENTISSQRICTHTWGYKSTMRNYPDKARDYCVRLARRLMKECPEWGRRLAEHEELAGYFRAVAAQPEKVSQ